MIKKLFAVPITIFIFLLLPTTTLAVQTGLGPIPDNPKGLADGVFKIALGAAGGIAFLLIIYGGFKLAFSQGDPKAIQDARDVITSAIVGLVLVVLSVFLLNLIGIDILGLPI